MLVASQRGGLVHQAKHLLSRWHGAIRFRSIACGAMLATIGPCPMANVRRSLWIFRGAPNLQRSRRQTSRDGNRHKVHPQAPELEDSFPQIQGGNFFGLNWNPKTPPIRS